MRKPSELHSPKKALRRLNDSGRACHGQQPQPQQQQQAQSEQLDPGAAGPRGSRPQQDSPGNSDPASRTSVDIPGEAGSYAARYEVRPPMRTVRVSSTCFCGEVFEK